MISPIHANNNSLFKETKVDTKNKRSEINNFSVRNNAVGYSSETLNFKYTSKDGDTVSLNYESNRFVESNTTVEGNTEKIGEDIDNVSRFVSEQITKLKKTQIHQILKNMGFIVSELDESDKIEETDEIETETGIDIDEYWNAENTSQRIADFAISFYGSFNGSDEEYLEIIKDAVSEGFSLAEKVIGEIPDSVSSDSVLGSVKKLTDSTYDLVMEKLDTWFAGLKNDDSEEIKPTDEQAV